MLWKVPYHHWKQNSVIHIHTVEELKTQNDIITTSCFFLLPGPAEFAYFKWLVDDESVGFGPIMRSNHNKTVSQLKQLEPGWSTGKPDQT